MPALVAWTFVMWIWVYATTKFIPLRFATFAIGSALLFVVFVRNALVLLVD